ncbi:MAG: hypothetical protein MJ175_11390, partial [Clostridia bacterium]|nr:hypothetical protein [Clostridia bacterium]
MSKYPISHEFFPFNLFAPPINPGFLRFAAHFMNAPGKFFQAKGVSVLRHTAESYDGIPVTFFT